MANWYEMMVQTLYDLDFLANHTSESILFASVIYFICLTHSVLNH